MADNTMRQAERAPGRTGSDIRHGRIVGLGIGVMVLMALALTAILGLTHYFSTKRPPATITSKIEPGQIPPLPRLQRDPPTDLHALRARTQTLLGSYGWVDKQADIVHIPIERAMELLAQKQTVRRRTQ